MNSEPTSSTIGAALAGQDRGVLRSVGAISLGIPLALGMLRPSLVEAVAVSELGVVLIVIITTALFGSRTLSERAFRLLRWFGNRPEPPDPGAGPTPAT